MSDPAACRGEASDATWMCSHDRFMAGAPQAAGEMTYRRSVWAMDQPQSCGAGGPRRRTARAIVAGMPRAASGQNGVSEGH